MSNARNARRAGCSADVVQSALAAQLWWVLGNRRMDRARTSGQQEALGSVMPGLAIAVVFASVGAARHEPHSKVRECRKHMGRY